MRINFLHGFLLSAYLPLSVLATSSTISQAEASNFVAHPTSTINTIPTSSTCPFRTVNYLSYTLPQQCLRASRSALNATAEPSQTTASIITLGEPSDTRNVTNGQEEAVEQQHRNDTISADLGETPSSDASKAPSVATVTESSVPTQQSTAPTDLDIDGDSPLDNANFLSFEEWKKQNLEKSGQSPDNVGQSHSETTGGNEARRRPGINNALDSIGEDQEIELDFGGFGKPKNADEAARGSPATGPSNEQATLAATSRSKDAGKTCKERFNYASFDCAATVLKTNPKAKSTSSVLVENKDSYMLNECHIDNKFIIVELCNDILIDTVVLANFEFFSSMFRTFRLSVSDRYPVKMERWKELGTFEARNSREVQAFLVENPLIWARYLRIEFLEHYGNEFYCPLSLVRVHGTTMLEEYRHQEETARDEDLAIEEVSEDVVKAEDSKRKEEEVKRHEEQQAAAATEADEKRRNSPTESVVQPSEAQSSEISAEPITSKSSAVEGAAGSSTSTLDQPQPLTDIPSVVIFERDPVPTCANPDNPPAESSASAGKDTVETTASTSPAITTQTSPPSNSPPSAIANSTSASGISNVTHSYPDPSPTTISNASDSRPPTNTTIPKSSTPSSHNSTRPAPTLQPSPSPSPPTQESFFKSVHKRLQTLESNSTLSLQYIESQSRILRDAFASAQKKQLTRTSAFLADLNATVAGELAGFRAQYDQLWQSTVIELAESRERQRREMEDVLLRLRVLADEVVWQKRVGMAQGMLVLVCLGMVMFAQRGGVGVVGNGLEIPAGGVGRGGGGGGKRRRLGVRLPWESPERSPESTFRGRWGLGKRGSWFAGEDSGPVSQAVSDGEGEAGGSDASGDERSVRDGKRRRDGLLTPTDISRPTTADRSESPEPPLSARSAPKETQSGPATPSGMRDLQDGVQEWEKTIAESSARREDENGGSGEVQSQPRQLRTGTAEG
ncbi:MAG: hypothetical protein Q9165_004075 [Trypethelium subeluteriae]